MREPVRQVLEVHGNIARVARRTSQLLAKAREQRAPIDRPWRSADKPRYQAPTLGMLMFLGAPGGLGEQRRLPHARHPDHGQQAPFGRSAIILDSRQVRQSSDKVAPPLLREATVGLDLLE